MKYVLEMTEAQMKVIKLGMELMTRLGLGQVEFTHEVLWKMHRELMADQPMWAKDNTSLHDYKLEMLKMVPNESLGIGNEKVSDIASTAYDIEQVVRKAIADSNGVTEGICARPPMRYGPEGLPKCKEIDDE